MLSAVRNTDAVQRFLAMLRSSGFTYSSNLKYLYALNAGTCATEECGLDSLSYLGLADSGRVVTEYRFVPGATCSNATSTTLVKEYEEATYEGHAKRDQREKQP